MAERTAVEIVRSLGITMTYQEVDDNPRWATEWNEPVRHYRCTLRYKRRKFETYCSMWDEEFNRLPTAPSMLGIILTEVAIFESCRDVSEFASIYSVDIDPEERVAERTYENLRQIAQEFRKFLSARVYKELTGWAMAAYQRSPI